MPEPGKGAFLGVELRDTGRLMGDVMFRWDSEENKTAEVGYVIHPDFAGNGYATEATRALLGLAFDGLDLHRVIACADERNGASAAVLRSSGMRQEAVLVENEWFKGEWTTELDFAILQSQWRAREG